MNKIENFGDKVLVFNKTLSKVTIPLPEGFKIVNPFNGSQKDLVNNVTEVFYKKYYNDKKKRKMILGSSPARKGSAVIGVPFEDATHLQNETGIFIDNFYINKSSSNFLFEVMNNYGGINKFYSDFYMNFVCPLGIAKINNNGKETNINYYENKTLENSLYDFIVNSIKTQVDFGIDNSVCYCIGSGENYKFLKKLNDEYKLFEKIIPLEHPRFIMQYNKNRKDEFIEKYIEALKNN